MFPSVGRPFVRYLGQSHGKIVSCAIPSDATDSPTAITAQTADNLMNLFMLLLFFVSLDAANIHLFPDMASAGGVFFCLLALRRGWARSAPVAPCERPREIDYIYIMVIL